MQSWEYCFVCSRAVQVASSIVQHGSSSRYTLQDSLYQVRPRGGELWQPYCSSSQRQRVSSSHVQSWRGELIVYPVPSSVRRTIIMSSHACTHNTGHPTPNLLMPKSQCKTYPSMTLEWLSLQLCWQHLAASHSLASTCYRCSKCGSLARPHVIWFGEALDSHVLNAVDEALKQCDLCLLVRAACGCMRYTPSTAYLHALPEVYIYCRKAVLYWCACASAVSSIQCILLTLAFKGHTMRPDGTVPVAY